MRDLHRNPPQEVWRGTASCGVVWCDVMWCGVVWCVWPGVVDATIAYCHGMLLVLLLLLRVYVMLVCVVTCVRLP